MLYGRPYSDVPRPCGRCENVTTERADCAACGTTVCEFCRVDADRPYCSAACQQAECSHTDISVEMVEDVDEAAGYAARYPVGTCRQCGERFEEAA
jgi:hypothetical protein